MTFKFEILIFGQQIMKMDINKFSFIFLPIMDEFHLMIFLFIQIINEIHSWKNDIHPYEIIHLWTYSSMWVDQNHIKL
jgi:hypothetical protein